MPTATTFRAQGGRRGGMAAALVAGLLFPGVLHAARVSDVAGADWLDQAARFLSFRDLSVRYAVCGAVLLGVCCGVLGGFVVVRKMALMGDTLSHAVLPGVALGFLWNLSKDPVAIFVGATLAGLLGTGMVRAITHTTRLKEDAALGLVLASFFAAGACLVTMIQRLPTGSKSGVDKFLFGQAAAINSGDVWLMLAVTVLVLGLVGLFYKELLIVSFDGGFARASGLPVAWIDRGLMLLLAFSVVIALQAVGAVLVSAMLITPAAAAYLLTDRLHRLLWLAAAFGVAAGVTGAFFSFLGHNLPTGPLMVIGASTVFAGAFFLGPRHGVLARWWRRRDRAARTRRENTLKSLYRIGEEADFAAEGATLTELARLRKETLEDAQRLATDLVRHGLATQSDDLVYFTPAGRQRAAEIVRNHRLWELYLTNSANIAADHVHEDAEKIEHVLGEEVVRDLERRLNHAAVDPHGRRIPTAGEIHRAAGLSGESGRK
ncbi:MAG TPA: metal ABC transporter permease [Opitutaceae bacterium]|nr:metal ABC transporter permease [Opitutaceae bacterium]